jgi:BirA family biotin operon repressor/biotin-[acetyl-CoA-carboxylase] ligase
MTHFPPNARLLVNKLNDGQVHSGNELAQSLNVTRAAIHKYMKLLSEYGVNIQRFHAKGYQLTHPLSLLDAQIIKKNTIKNVDPNILTLKDSVESTNDFLKEKSLNNQRLFCLAEHQSKGRGRQGRQWYSPWGQNLYLSMSHQIQDDSIKLSGFSLVVGIQVCLVLQALYPNLHPKIKWPNDIFIGDKKIAGILVEILSESHVASRVITGVGLNVNMAGLDASHTNYSLYQALGCTIDRNKLAAKLIDGLISLTDEFLETGLDFLYNNWSHYDYLYNKHCSLLTPSGGVNGVAKGIDANGLLRLKLNSGQTKTFSSGDVHIERYY